MNCQETLVLLDAYFDNELDLPKAMAIEEHLCACSSCPVEYEQRTALRSRLEDPDLRHHTPANLADRICQRLELPSRLKRKIIPFPAIAWVPTAIAAAAIFGAFLFANIERLLPAETSLLAEVASDHIRSLIGTHLIDVESSDEHTVKPWFAGKVDFSPPVLDFADRGFKLVGGRLDYVEGKNVAVLVYRFKKHYVSLFMYREPNSEPAAKEKLLNYQGYNLVYWNIYGLDCWAISDAAPVALLEFVNIQQQEHS